MTPTASASWVPPTFTDEQAAQILQCLADIGALGNVLQEAGMTPARNMDEGANNGK